MSGVRLKDVEKFPSEWMRAFVKSAFENYPTLSQSEERAMIAENEHDRERLAYLLTMHNLAFVAQMASKNSGLYSTMDADDLIMIGLAALWKSAMSFDASRGVRFFSYAGEAVKHEVFAATERAEYVRERRSMSLDEQVKGIMNNGEDVDRIDIILKGQMQDFQKPATPSEIVESEDLSMFVTKLLDRIGMDKRDIEDFKRNIGGTTQVELAQEYGVTKEAIRQRLAKVRERARREMKKVEHQLAAYGERRLCSVTNWDRVAVHGKTHNGRKCRTTSWYSEHVAGLIAFERYKLGIKNAEPLMVRKEKTTVLTGKCFTARRLIENRRTFIFKDGKWIPAPKEESYGFEEDCDGRSGTHVA